MALLTSVAGPRSAGPPVRPSVWYAAPTGTPRGAGTRERPWDLGTALAGGNGKIAPGDTVWLRGGVYRGAFISTLTGAPGLPIVVRQYPGERATLDGGDSPHEILTVDGQWAMYWGFEIMASGDERWCADCLGLRPDGVYVRKNAAHIKLINLVIHDVGHGTYTENQASDIEIYGWIVYNGGNENKTRSDGHGIYIKNGPSGWKVARDNVIFNQFGFGIHAYTEVTSGTLLNLVLDGNVLFNNGSVSSFDNNLNLQLGGNAVADNDTVTNNLLYDSPGVGWANLRIGYKKLVNGTAVFRNNYIVGGREAIQVGQWRNLLAERNETFTPGDPGSQPTVFVKPNRYEPGRATVVIYNWTRLPEVAVDLRGVLRPGAQFTIHNVQDVFGAPVKSGTYTGGQVTFPMTGVNPPRPIGGAARAPLRTAPAFDVFLVTS
jgi:hypothetical protein